MSSILKNKAAAAVNKGYKSSFYPSDKSNPVLSALDQEIKSFVAYMKKRANAGGAPLSNEESCSRHADTLFELWNKYESKLDKLFYQSKLIEMGDFLVSIQEYHLALWQCYGRYLKSSGDVNVEEVTDVESFKQAFFPDGFDTKDAGFTFRALMGKSICSFQMVKSADPRLQNPESVEKCVVLLGFLRLVTQVILPKERLCWLVYNGTIHIYSISRYLMSLGHSAKVLEYVLWACMCMESSVPLLAVKYLTWRATLYTAVCQCYYDCKQGHHAEAFARRALTKINELSQLESMSSATENKDTEEAFRHATIKMAIMVYKRVVFETRRRPKGLLRPKTRANLKDAAQLPWPRTQTEKLLVEMCEGGAAQGLCVLETVADPNRRMLLSAPPAADNEVEILDVYAELFMAAQEIINGGGGTPNPTGQKSGADIKTSNLSGIVKEKSLIEMAAKGENGIPLSAVVKIVKLAYCYEQWDALDALLGPTMSAIKEANDPNFGPEEKMLELLQAYDRVVPRSRHRKLFTNTEQEPEEETTEGQQGVTQPASQGTLKGALNEDNLIQLAEVLLSIVNGPYAPAETDIDMVVDACLLMWNKAKVIFQRFQTGSTDNPKYLQKMDNPSKWVYILDIVHQTLGWCGLSSVDPALTAEVTLRLALVYEASAALEGKDATRKGRGKLADNKNRDMDDDQSVMSSVKDPQTGRISALSTDSAPRPPGMTSVGSVYGPQSTNQSVREQLLQARDIVETGLASVAYARQAVSLTDGKNVADVGWVKEFNKELFAPILNSVDTTVAVSDSTADSDTAKDQDTTQPDINGDGSTGGDTSVWNTVRDLNVELIYMYHRVCLRLAALGPEPPQKPGSKPFVRRTCSRIRPASSTRLQDNYIETFDELVTMTRRSHLSRSLLYMQKALVSGTGGNPNAEQKKLLQESMALIRKAETEEKRLYTENTVALAAEDDEDFSVTPSKVPPAPLLLCRTDGLMVFRPAKFEPVSGEKVSWYRLFARNAAGSNVKVRLNDYYLPGTGEEVPSFRCELRVSGLTPGEKYVFAVAAYTAEGKLIGGSVGASTRPVLAMHPLPVLVNWAYLCQLAYQVGCYPVAREACEVLWSHFVATPPPPQDTTYLSTAERDFRLTQHRLNHRIVALSSPVLLRMFLASVFIHVDISVKEGRLFCDTLCDKGPLHKGQIGRLSQCERMLVCLELAGWLNEANLALQAVVQCYGLVAPMIHFKIPSIPIIQVLERCNAVLQEIPANLRQKRSSVITDGLHHMTACLTYYMAKVLRQWGQRALAANINDSGRKLLTPEDKPSGGPGGGGGGPGGSSDTDLLETTESGSLTLAALKKKKTKKAPVVVKDEGDVTGNEELRALEAHMLRLSKQAQGEHDLTGNEDPTILHAYIAYLPSRISYKEVMKFKKRMRYLEFFVQTAQKGLSEGIPEICRDWCDETLAWLTKRNEGIIGSKATVGKQPGATTIIGDDPKKFAAHLAEYTKDTGGKDKDSSKTKTAAKAKPKKIKYKAIGVTPNMSDAQKQQQEELELKALEILKMYFVDLYLMSLKRKKLRKISTEEMPWRSQFNIVYGLSEFGMFLSKLDAREDIAGVSYSYLYKTSALDAEWFGLESAGTLVVEWSGGPTRQHTRQGALDADVTAAGGRDGARASGIERAAAAATGKQPPPQYPLPKEEEDTPRTYRSEGDVTARPPRGGAQRGGQPGGHKKRQEETPGDVMLSRSAAVEMLNRTFLYLRRALVIAHRGQHWTLLQNACRVLWNVTHTALLRGRSPGGGSAAAHGGGPDTFLAVRELRAASWEAFCLAADCLLDMMGRLQQDGGVRRGKGKKDPDPPLPGTVRPWLGPASEEQGGAGLRFDAVLDDLSVVDVRWVYRVVLRTLQMLYYEHKWERLVDIALRFNALTEDRYAEQIHPLLVQAQRKLIRRVTEHGGRPTPQPHFLVAMGNNRQPITAQQYSTMQLEVQIDRDDLSEIAPGAQIDPEGHDLYGGGVHALRLCSVPLDVDYSLKSLRSALDKSNYSARALQHSRKLLTLYLSGQTNTDQALLGSSGPSRVDFVPNTAKPQPTSPPDLSKEEFLSMDDVQTSPLPKSQVHTVISSYDKTIEMLLAGGQKSLAAEAMRELGNLHYHVGNIRGAYKWWAESLDLVLGAADAIHKWREMFSGVEDISKALLDKCGLWGCVFGGILASNIAQYILTSDLGLRTESCFLAGYFYKALFRASLPHPTADKDYALYEVGDGCEVTHLVPGIDLLSERFRCDGRTLVSAVRFVVDELARGRQNLFVLPLLTLYLHLTTFTCRDLARSVSGRILAVRVLTDLRMFSAATVTLQRLLAGDRLPHAADATFRQTESKPGVTRFNEAKPLTEPCNLKVLETVVDKRLSSNLSSLYGPHLTCELSIAQAHLMVAIADTIPTLPKFEDVVKRPPGTSSLIQPPPPPPGKDRKRKTAGSPIKAPAQAQPTQGPPTVPNVASLKAADDQDAKSQTVSEDASTVQTSGKRFSDGRQPVSLDVVKGVLLATADIMLGTLSEIVLENAANSNGLSSMTSSELELVVQCKLEMSAIAGQRHHATLAARLTLAALGLIADAKVFRGHRSIVPEKRLSALRRDRASHQGPPGPPGPPGRPSELDTSAPQYAHLNAQSRARLDARLWLTCYLQLVRSLTAEIRGMGDVRGPDRPVRASLSEVRQYCAEGLTVAEACGDLETQAELMYQAVILNTLDGRDVGATQTIIQDIVSLLLSVAQPSPPALLLLSRALTHRADLAAMTPDQGVGRLEASVTEYTGVQGAVLEQLESLGEHIEHRYDAQREYSTPDSPICNLYQPHLLLLAQLKLRIGYSQARGAAKVVKDRTTEEAASLWTEALGSLTTALNICRVISARVPSLEAELLLNIGKIQRQMYHIGLVHCRVVADTLVEAIKTSFASDHDISLMRQAYLELAVLYMASSGLVLVREGSILESAAESDADDSSVTSKESKRKSRKVQEDAPRRRSKKTAPLPEDDRDREKRAAWVALRCATALADAQRARAGLQGDPKVTSAQLGDKLRGDVPDFLALDLVGSYVLGEKKRVYKNEIEEELATLTEELEPPPVETYDDQLSLAKETATELNWIHVVGYQAILQRLCSTSTMSSQKDSTKSDQTQKPDTPRSSKSAASVLDQFDISMNQDVVRSVIFSPEWSMRLSVLHNFLVANLPVYAGTCTAIYPPAAVQLPIPADLVANPEKQLPPNIIAKQYLANTTIPLDVQPEATSVTNASQSDVAAFRRSDKIIVSPTESELCIQWFLPSLDEHSLTVQESNDDDEEDDTVPRGPRKERQVMLLYASWQKKTEKQSCSVMWVSLSQLIGLHDSLSVLTQRAEISLVDKPTPKKDSSTTAGGTKGKKTARIKALSPKVKKDELLEETFGGKFSFDPEALLRQCMADAQALIGYNPAPEEPPEAPTPATGPNNTPAPAPTPGANTEAGENTERKSPTRETREKSNVGAAEEPPQPEVPFDITKSNLYSFERLYDPSLGACLNNTKMLKWFNQFFP